MTSGNIKIFFVKYKFQELSKKKLNILRSYAKRQCWKTFLKVAHVINKSTTKKLLPSTFLEETLDGELRELETAWQFISEIVFIRSKPHTRLNKENQEDV